MKTIGLIGGMSWESSAIYYRLLNEGARERLGGLHSAELVMWSFDFAEIEALQADADWDQATARIIDAARNVEAAGAACLLICTNTMHRMADDVQAAIDIPLLHIADATAEAVKAASKHRPVLLGTRYTMEQDFYKGRLETNHGIDVIVPDDVGRTVVHDIIYDELCRGIVTTASKQAYLDIVAGLESGGADSVIFGCTEVGMLIGPKDLSISTFDTTRLHADAALRFAIGD